MESYPSANNILQNIPLRACRLSHFWHFNDWRLSSSGGGGVTLFAMIDLACTVCGSCFEYSPLQAWQISGPDSSIATNEV
jgi:hypothetical protein